MNNLKEKFDAIFKAYDIRGVYPDQIDEKVVFQIALGFVDFLKPKKVALGRDVRFSSPSLFNSVKNALISRGIEVWDIGEITTDQLYFAVAYYNLDGGMTITASHNPKEYNGIKFVRERSMPISADNGLLEIKDLALQAKEGEGGGTVREVTIINDYLDYVVQVVKIDGIKPFKFVANPNFGVASENIKKFIEKYNLPCQIIPLNFEKNGNFPKGRPDPLIPENRQETSQLIKENQADFGVAWDADADRCFFFDENGDFIHPNFITAVLVEEILKKYPGGTVIHDTRAFWAVKEAVEKNGGVLVLNKAGHAFLKEALKNYNGVFAAETSAHYYFKDFYNCDNGFLPFLYILKILSEKNQSLAILVQEWRGKYAISDEINFKADNPEKIEMILDEIQKEYQQGAVNLIDGISYEFGDWRFNLRPSNTEPLVRLNIEAKSEEILEEKINELTEKIKKLVEGN